MVRTWSSLLLGGHTVSGGPLPTHKDEAYKLLLGLCPEHGLNDVSVALAGPIYLTLRGEKICGLTTGISS